MPFIMYVNSVIAQSSVHINSRQKNPPYNALEEYRKRAFLLYKAYSLIIFSPSAGKGIFAVLDNNRHRGF